MKKIEFKNNALLKDIVTLLNLIIVGYAAILVFLTILSVISYTGLSDTAAGQIADMADARSDHVLAAQLRDRKSVV